MVTFQRVARYEAHPLAPGHMPIARRLGIILVRIIHPSEGGCSMTEEHTEKAAPASDDVGLIEKAFLMGIGAAMLAKEKVEELADDLVKRGKITREESDSFVNRLVDEADKSATSAQKTVARETEKVVEKMGLASKKDLDDVHAELTEIKALLASLRPLDGGSAES
jgi:polyhydroxyalkanoate synthesis regulator phasin